MFLLKVGTFIIIVCMLFDICVGVGGMRVD
jgi:hypothetical protein